MKHRPENNADGAAGVGLGEIERSCFTDIHCHCLAGVDDGVATMAEAISLCRALVADNVSVVIATPHQLGRYNDCNRASIIRDAVGVLNEELVKNGIALSVVAGGDVRVDERICQLLKSDEILTLADGGKYLLLELPREIFINIEPLIVELCSMGIEAVISHPERHRFLSKQPGMIRRWLRHSAHLQITAGSLLGRFGNSAERSAWELLSSGLARLVATDSHNPSSRGPCMKAAFECISSRLGRQMARLVCIENPSRVLKSQPMSSLTLNTGKCSDERTPITASRH